MDPSLAAALLKAMSALPPGTLVTVVALVTLTPMGLVGLIMVCWQVEDRRRRVDLTRYREDMDRILHAYGEDLRQVTRYYQDNVKLVTAYESLATSLHDQVVLNTQVMQRMYDAICTNQYCPPARLAKGDSPLRGGL